MRINARIYWNFVQFLRENVRKSFRNYCTIFVQNFLIGNPIYLCNFSLCFWDLEVGHEKMKYLVHKHVFKSDPGLKLVCGWTRTILLSTDNFFVRQEREIQWNFWQIWLSIASLNITKFNDYSITAKSILKSLINRLCDISRCNTQSNLSKISL